MDKKCSKYEGLFVFSDEETLQKHLEECPDCRAEHEKMQRVSELIGETKFYYKSKFKQARKLKAICALAMFMFFTASFSVISDNTDLADSLMYGDTLTAEDLGFPVDSYGFIVVDDEF
jgi:hypothetical protein